MAVVARITMIYAAFELKELTLAEARETQSLHL